MDRVRVQSTTKRTSSGVMAPVPSTLSGVATPVRKTEADLRLAARKRSGHSAYGKWRAPYHLRRFPKRR